jgi:serine/threonine protein kinase
LETVARWEQGEPADAPAYLDANPELLAFKSVVLDLAHADIRQRGAMGPAAAEDFCNRFPRFRSSVRKLVEVYQYFRQHPEELPDVGEEWWPEAGEVFLGYDLVEELGGGKLARVFRATEPALGNRPVVVKVSFLGSVEAGILGKLRHPAIVPIHSVTDDPESGLTAICMPYLGPTTLADVIDELFRGGRVPTRAREILAVTARGPEPDGLAAVPDPVLCRASYVDGVVHLGSQIADALAYAHRMGICHRDLKPSNVLLSRDGRARLLDFNLSFDRLGGIHLVGGTVPYMSPEQLQGIAHPAGAAAPTIDERSDLYALGVVLYQSLTGLHPFGQFSSDDRWQESRARLLPLQQAGAPPLRRVNADVDPHVAALVERCLRFDPRERTRSAAELAAALRAAVRRPRRWLRWASVRRRAVRCAAALLVASTAAGAYLLHTRPPYADRLYRDGLAAHARGEYRQAIEYFSRGIDSAGPRPALLFARGRAYQHLDLRLALADYLNADRAVPDPQNKAALAYCCSKQQQYREAVAYYQQAIAGGLDGAAVFNNLGYCHLLLSQLTEAERCLDAAIGRDPNLQAALHNRAMLRLSQALRSSSSVRAGISDIERAIGLGPATADLHGTAARLYALAARQDRRYVAPALDHLAAACDLGWDTTRLKSEPMFRELRREPVFQALAARPQASVRHLHARCIVDPIAESPVRGPSTWALAQRR